ncbi:DNA-directed RNA polymerase subunit K [Candidatus Bathyarchaeota archaeon]|nr:DNA-directed RNA polymerase subunit K [Candidatus Bathyarchaeota archaeon]MBS7614036.1 DNA-directed RNA polymerase subunit K [Candidatus Bathyarchaeota archaeon]MBS7617389.1 DNA-directed RNA polymerase subunit K [Candidatus Bathyarchaeota archaeon]
MYRTVVEKSEEGFSKSSEKVSIGPPRLTKYEKARIVGARALQISMGAPILVKLPEGFKDPVEIALYELEKGVLPITVRRKLPDGTYQDIPLKWLLEKS